MDDCFVNLGEEVILSLQRQSGAISLSICYWLFKCWVLHVVCVCVCVHVQERDSCSVVCVCARVCAHVCDMRETRSCKHGLFANTYELHYCLSGDSVPLSGLKFVVKLRTLLAVFTIVLKAEDRDSGKGSYISDLCLWCSANHNALGQLANHSRRCLSEGGAL